MDAERRFDLPDGLTPEEERAILTALERYFLRESPKPAPWAPGPSMRPAGCAAGAEAPVGAVGDPGGVRAARCGPCGPRRRPLDGRDRLLALSNCLASIAKGSTPRRLRARPRSGAGAGHRGARAGADEGTRAPQPASGRTTGPPVSPPPRRRSSSSANWAEGLVALQTSRRSGRAWGRIADARRSAWVLESHREGPEDRPAGPVRATPSDGRDEAPERHADARPKRSPEGCSSPHTWATMPATRVRATRPRLPQRCSLPGGLDRVPYRRRGHRAARGDRLDPSRARRTPPPSGPVVPMRRGLPGEGRVPRRPTVVPRRPAGSGRMSRAAPALATVEPTLELVPSGHVPVRSRVDPRVARRRRPGA
jgi:hypothetical protein